MQHGWLASAGPYTIEHEPCPDYAGDVDLVAPPKGVLHTTEGSWDSAMSVFRQHYAPHFLVGPGRIAQLLPLGRAAAALEHPAGTPPTNGAVRVQIEIVGRSSHTTWLPDEKTTDALAWLMAELEHVADIPLARTNPARNERLFAQARGWLGHADVPHNEHWDPGELNYPVLLRQARAKIALPRTLTEDEERNLFFVWRRQGGQTWQRPPALRDRIPATWWVAYAKWLVTHPWPLPLPAWYWKWQAWKDGARATRPADAPRFIPLWAWRRYALHKGDPR